MLRCYPADISHGVHVYALYGLVRGFTFAACRRIDLSPSFFQSGLNFRRILARPRADELNERRDAVGAVTALLFPTQRADVRLELHHGIRKLWDSFFGQIIRFRRHLQCLVVFVRVAEAQRVQAQKMGAPRFVARDSFQALSDEGRGFYELPSSSSLL
jgi:hypothetical protein